MEFWFTENDSPNVKFSIRVDKQLYSASSEFQRIDVFDSLEFGRFLTLDGFMMMTEKDEFIYHEMMTHVAMAVHPQVERVLVIGGGDGGVLRELGHYPEIRQIDLVEIDEMVIKVCREYLPLTACGFDDPRVKVIIADGLQYIRTVRGVYDLIIVDSTDPFGPGEGLFTREFYGNCSRALKADGILINQHESPFYTQDALACQRTHRNIVKNFANCRVYQAHIPTYPSGHWLFGFASNTYRPLKDLDAGRWDQRGIQTKYYTTHLHKGAFYLPAYVEDLLSQVEE